MNTITVKRGDTVLFTCAVTDDAGSPVDLTGSAIAMQVRQVPGLALVEELDVDIDAGTGGTFTGRADATASLVWPLGSHRCDIRITDADDAVTHSETFAIAVAEGVTQDVSP